MTNKTHRQGLLAGAFILLISNIFVKGLGFAYRVILVRQLGAAGIGLVEMTTPLFSFLLVLAGCGVQPALSQLAAGADPARQLVYFRTARRILMLTGLAVTLLAWFLTPFLLRYFAADPRIELCLRAILPAIFIISLASAWRGAFQGEKRISVLGGSQNVEQIIRVALGIWLVGRLLPMGMEQAAAAVSLATVGGELAGLCYLIIRRERFRNPLPPLSYSEQHEAARRLLTFGLPTTAGRCVSTAVLMLQSFLIPICLQQAGFPTESATEIYGRFSGVAMTLLHLPGVFTSALSVAALPAVAESQHASRLLHQRIQDVLCATISFTLPGMLLLTRFAVPLCAGLFDNAPAAQLLQLLTPGGIFFYLQISAASILQGMGQVRALLRNGILSGLALIGGILLLTPLPSLHIRGAVLALDISWLTGCVLNLLTISRCSDYRPNWRELIGQPLLAAAIALFMMLIVEQVYGTPTTTAAYLAAAAAFCGIYLAVLAFSGGLRRFKRQRRS